MSALISSTSNDLIKKLLVLQSKSRARRKEGLYVVEGFRELSLALGSGVRLKSLLICEEIARPEDISALESLLSAADASDSKGPARILISRKVYEHVAHRKTTEGLIGIAITEELSLDDLRLGENPLLLVAEASEKPGNTGALLRTADAARLDAVLIANPRTDLYNPNIIRSSMGCVFTQQVICASSEEIIAYLKKKNIRIFAAALSPASQPYYGFDYRGPSAIAVGTEDRGLSEEWLEQADASVIIPMEGKIDSLNLSVSAAILIFEAKRQRALPL